mmetsp:Transcript_31402/g.57916  ORF Transcript_31402/g.57916 Transcript_31402/m.57916 type:complete len:95 (-) Transcript_31402:124-408(-)
MSQEKKITVVKGMSQEELQAKGVFSWGKWGCEVSNFPWTYSQNEEAYILEGKVTVIPDYGEPVEIEAGDYVTFPAGMSCTWDVTEAIDKHYNFF